jgi:RNA polymerase sigma factor (sigma-70 family)
LRARAVRLYPRDIERQENAVTEFFSLVLVAESEKALPILARYDGQRPLTPWLIRIFQNWHISKLRVNSHTQALPDDDVSLPLPAKTETRWHEAFLTAARTWLDELSEQELLLLGMRWRYRFSQRDIAARLKVHEGTISRQTDKLRDHCLQKIGEELTRSGWNGEELEEYILTEMQGVLMDEPRLGIEQLGQLLRSRGIPGS